jgi:hypothetical protein
MHREVAILTVLLLATAGAAHAQFLEPDVEVLSSFTAETPGDGFGWAGEKIGDIDGDGSPDYTISAPFNNEAGAGAGKIYVYSGATGALLATQLGNPADGLGWGITGGGDFDNDGVPDYAAGGPAPQGGGNGRVVMYSGADHSVLHDIGAPFRNLLGYDINVAGDVDGDGHDDLIAGAITDSFSFPLAGSVTIYSGRDGSVIWRADGPGQFSLLGSGVTGLCDLNGDGIPEQAAAGFRAGVQSNGLAYVLNGADGAVLHEFRPNGTGGNFGQFFVHDAGDVDADGYCDVYVGDFADQQGGRGYVFSGATGERLRLITADNPGDGLGIARGAGDVDGDGHADLLIGAYVASDAAPQGGQNYLISGKNGQLRRTLTGTAAGAQLGFDAVTIGDVNGDDLTDFLITGVDVAYVVAGIELDANGDN